ncbi:MAG: glycerol kinase [Marinilabiliales bacterium]|nr:MAG: glycerol kinase [Marinilabiliales bacterium]
MSQPAILAIDQSTSATKAVLFDRGASVVARLSKEHAQIYPQPGWVEHDAEEIMANTLEVIGGITSGQPDAGIVAIAITNQRETAVVWDGKTGKPLYNAIVWQCNRGAERCDRLRQDGWEERIREKTGLIIDPYFSATAISWILDNVPGAREKAERGELLFGTTDSWLIWNLTGGRVHATDYSNACRTMLFNINTLSWDNEIMDELGIPLSMAPEVRFSDDKFGETTAAGTFSRPVPITGVMGDSHAALFGQLCFTPGMTKATYGTGSSIMMNIGTKPLPAPRGLVTSIGYGVKGSVAYVFEGNIHSTGSAIKWLRDDLQLIGSVEETAEIAASVGSTEGVYLVPAFAGLGAPYWSHRARAMICGMTFSTRKAHVVRAALESIAYQVKDLVDLMKEGAGIDDIELRVDGGPVKNDFLMQFQADILGGVINRSSVEEASASGVMLAAGLYLRWWNKPEELSELRKGELIKGSIPKGRADDLYSGWKTAVARTLFKGER